MLGFVGSFKIQRIIIALSISMSTTDMTLMEQVKNILIEHSKKPMALAKHAVLKEEIKYGPLREALYYFVEEIWYDAATHTSLISLSTHRWRPDATVDIGAAIALLTGAADIHDDIIDESTIKGDQLTVYGKYGKDIAIIAADILWIKGMSMLNEACEHFSSENKRAIHELVRKALSDIGSAEAKEAK